MRGRGRGGVMVDRRGRIGRRGTMIGGSRSLMVMMMRSGWSLAGPAGSEEVDEGTGEVTDQPAQQGPGLSPGSQSGRSALAKAGGDQEEQEGDQEGDQELLHLYHRLGGREWDR